MPPRAKFTKKEIVDTALNIVREKGIEAVTARELGTRLNASSRPIFTVFQNMEEVLYEVKVAAIEVFNDYTKEFEFFTPAFKKFGMQWVSFAINEPRLFKLLFMQRRDENTHLGDIVVDFFNEPEVLIDVIKKDYSLDDEYARKLYNQLWVHTYGICVLCATGACTFTQEEISLMLGETFFGLMTLYKGKHSDDLIGENSPLKDYKAGDLPFWQNK